MPLTYGITSGSFLIFLFIVSSFLFSRHYWLWCFWSLQTRGFDPPCRGFVNHPLCSLAWCGLSIFLDLRCNILTILSAQCIRVLKTFFLFWWVVTFKVQAPINVGFFEEDSSNDRAVSSCKTVISSSSEVHLIFSSILLMSVCEAQWIFLLPEWCTYRSHTSSNSSGEDQQW